MKSSLFTSILLIAAVAVTAQGPKTKSVHLCTNEPASNAREKLADVHPSQSAQFRSGTLIEVAFMSVKPGKEKELSEEYFAKIMPVAMEYGLKPLMTVGVENAYSETIKPQMIGFFEWPSVTKKEAFEKDDRFIKLKQIRTGALSFLKVGFFEVSRDMTVKLDASLFYEVYGMDLKEETADQMGKYFEKAGPICIKDYGVDFALAMTPVQVGGFDGRAAGGYEAQSFGIAIWPNEAANKKFFSSREYAQIKHFKEDSVKTIEAWQGTVILK